MPRNSLPNGEAAPDTGGLQLDETSYPILMDWQSGLAHDSSLYENHVIPAADFLVANGPSDGVERWEEQSGYSPSTIAAEIAGLTAAAAIARVNHDPPHAAIYQATADYFARNIENWTVTTNGPYISASVPEYFIRVTKGTNPTTGQADPDVPYDYMLNNGNMTNVDQRAVIDAGFLDLVRLGVLPGQRPGGAVLAHRRRRHDRAPDPRAAPASTATATARRESDRRLRRLLSSPAAPGLLDRARDRRAMATDRHGHRAPVAGAERRARRVRDRRRRLRLRRRSC